MVLFRGVQYDDSPGSWFDRGSADSYYGRHPSPHRWVGGQVEISTDDSTRAEYMAGYRYNEEQNNFKDYR